MRAHADHLDNRLGDDDHGEVSGSARDHTGCRAGHDQAGHDQAEAG
jgi:hypothetical protein